ncbi:MAG TPA: carboxymuconolactone decarboxylase family protein [Sphingobium sp.]|uniref:carboxymuconolactone decarboxylase family protein n=1 Tax=Sphingobium sp. TaxID=1912891 RepID=UPI002ED3173F
MGHSSNAAEISQPSILERNARIVGRPPRLAPLKPEDLTDDVRRMTDELQIKAGVKPDGIVPDYLATMLRYPELYTAHTELARLLMVEGALAVRDRELAIMRIGWLCQAPYEWNAHMSLSKRVLGITPEEVEQVIIGSSAPEWNDDDRMILRAVEELFDDAMISDETWAELASRLDERQLIELPVVIGHYQGLAYLQNALRIALLPGDIGLVAR